jgi:hypothetical protein
MPPGDALGRSVSQALGIVTNILYQFDDQRIITIFDHLQYIRTSYKTMDSE